jgi:hypothetical protein
MTVNRAASTSSAVQSGAASSTRCPRSRGAPRPRPRRGARSGPGPDRPWAPLQGRCATAAGRGGCVEEGFRRRRQAIGIARLGAREGVEERGAVPHRERHAQLRAGSRERLADGGEADPPREGFRPKRPQSAAGMRIEPPPSVAWAIGRARARHQRRGAAARTARRQSGIPGVAHGPPKRGSVVGASPNSLDRERPTRLSPLRRMRATAGAVGGRRGIVREERGACRRGEPRAIRHEVLDHEGHPRKGPRAGISVGAAAGPAERPKVGLDPRDPAEARCDRLLGGDVARPGRARRCRAHRSRRTSVEIA